MIDVNGHLHDRAGRYAGIDGGEASYELPQPAWMPQFGDAEYDRQVGELVGLAMTSPLDLVPAPTRALTPEEDEAYRASVYAAADERKANEALLVERFGSVEQAVVHLGESVAARAETYAEITADEVRSSWQARSLEAELALQHARDQRDAYLRSPQYRALLDPHRQALKDEMRAAAIRHDIAHLEARSHDRRHEARSNDGEIFQRRADFARHQVRAARAAYAADPLVAAAREQASAALQHQQDSVTPYKRAINDAREHLTEVAAGEDEETRGDLARLAFGYRQALSDVRAMGGTIELHPASHPDAVAAFGEAMGVYPADWIAASNKKSWSAVVHHGDEGAVRVVSEAPLVSISDSRAHYTSGKPIERRRRIPDSEVRSGTSWDSSLVPGQNLTTADGNYVWVQDGDPLRAQANDPAAPMWRYQRFEAVDASSVEGKPHGTGWGKFRDPSGRNVWRRPRYVVDEVEKVYSPQIVTNKQTDSVTLPKSSDQGHVMRVSGTFTVSVHESAHRFEETVSGLVKVSRDFVTRRATRPDGSVAPLAPIYQGVKDEVARDGGFVDPYMGREYESGSGEAFSTGMEALFGGSFGGLVGVGGRSADADHRAFTLGMLAGIGKRRASWRDVAR